MKKYISYLLIFAMFLTILPIRAIAKDYANPKLENEKFIKTTIEGSTTILHKFSFGNDPSQVEYMIYGNAGDLTFEPPGFLDLLPNNLNSTYPGKTFNLFRPEKFKDNNTTPIDSNVAIVALKDGDSYTLIGLYFVGNYYNGGCDGTATFNGVTINNRTTPDGIGKNVIGKTSTSQSDMYYCLYNIYPSYNNAGKNALFNNDYQIYGSLLYNDLATKHPKTTLGKDSANMVADAGKISSCHPDSALTGIINNDPNYIPTFIDSLLAQVKDENKPKMREFLNQSDVKVSDDEDKQLFLTYYATDLKYASDPKFGYANKYMDDLMLNNFLALQQKAIDDASLSEVYSQKLWFEKYWATPLEDTAAKGTAATAIATGGALAYSVGAKALVGWMNGLQAVSKSTLLLRIGLAFSGSGQAAGAVAGAALVPALIALIGVIIIAGVLYWYAQTKKHINKAFVHSAFLSLYARTYIEANYQSQKCTGLWDKPENSGQQENYDAMIKSSNSALKSIQSTMASVASDLGDSGPCASLKPTVLWDIKKQISFAFCGLGLMLQDFSNALMEGAITTFAQVIGFMK